MSTTPARTAPAAAIERPVVARSSCGPITATRPRSTSPSPTRTRIQPWRSDSAAVAWTPSSARLRMVARCRSSLCRHSRTTPAPTIRTGPHRDTRIGRPRAASPSSTPSPRARIPRTPVRSQPGVDLPAPLRGLGAVGVQGQEHPHQRVGHDPDAAGQRRHDEGQPEDPRGAREVLREPAGHATDPAIGHAAHDAAGLHGLVHAPMIARAHTSCPQGLTLRRTQGRLRVGSGGNRVPAGVARADAGAMNETSNTPPPVPDDQPDEQPTTVLGEQTGCEPGPPGRTRPADPGARLRPHPGRGPVLGCRARPLRHPGARRRRSWRRTVSRRLPSGRLPPAGRLPAAWRGTSSPAPTRRPRRTLRPAPTRRRGATRPPAATRRRRPTRPPALPGDSPAVATSGSSAACAVAWPATGTPTPRCCAS